MHEVLARLTFNQTLLEQVAGGSPDIVNLCVCVFAFVVGVPVN